MNDAVDSLSYKKCSYVQAVKDGDKEMLDFRIFVESEQTGNGTIEMIDKFENWEERITP